MAKCTAVWSVPAVIVIDDELWLENDDLTGKETMILPIVDDTDRSSVATIQQNRSIVPDKQVNVAKQTK